MLQLLLAGKTPIEAAKTLGISNRIITRWLELPHVIDAYTVMKKNVADEQAQVVQLLANGKTSAEVAKELGITAKIIERWLELPHVAQPYTTLKKAHAEDIGAQIEQLTSKAIQALSESLDCKEMPSIRLKASQVVLDRVAPMPNQQQQGQQPGQLLDSNLLSYLTDEELATIQRIMETAEARKRQAEADRQHIEERRA